MGQQVRAVCPLCRALHIGRGYCTSCLKKKGREYQRKRTDGEHMKFYSSARWKVIRDSVIRRDPVCQQCGVESTVVVHHIVDRKNGGDDTLSNLQGLCKKCHQRHHNKQRRGTTRAQWDAH